MIIIIEEHLNVTRTEHGLDTFYYTNTLTGRLGVKFLTFPR